jgi:predicted 2-oxoglutarate/Fe(II)-dependent dioxygenase YbiX
LPIDRFRLEIDEAWGRGAKLGNLHLAKNLKAFAGLVRIFSQGSGTEIHLDKLAWDLEQIDQANTEVMIQLAVNVYLDLPESGGEVKLWRISPDKKEYEKYRNKNSYGLDEGKMPKPDLVFKPKIGDLWLFRASELHQVVEAGKGRRVTQSCFVGFRGDDEYLIIWS